MRVHVLYFGVLKDVYGRAAEAMDLPPETTVGALLGTMEGHGAAGAVPWRSLAVAVNREYVDRTAVLRGGDEVALLPPVSGGGEGAAIDAD